jgi:hypothetical protein
MNFFVSKTETNVICKFGLSSYAGVAQNNIPFILAIDSKIGAYSCTISTVGVLRGSIQMAQQCRPKQHSFHIRYRE